MPDTQIIYIDDDALIRRAVGALLSRWYPVVIFDNPGDAIQHIRGLEDDAIILCDHDMPQMTGLQVYAELAEHHQRRFILFTGNTQHESPSGHTVYKPSSVDELRRAIEAASA